MMAPFATKPRSRRRDRRPRALRAPPRLSWLAVVAAGFLSACNIAEQLGQVGQPPTFEPIVNPTQEPDYYSVSMPMPAPREAGHHPNSLWRTGARAFFKDQRAAQVGDILTVLIAIDDDASLSNETTRERDNQDTTDLTGLFGYETNLNRVFPQQINPSNLLDIDSQLDQSGKGEITRDDVINLKIAAVVTQILPNGNMVIQGDQELLVNFELRKLTIHGVIRPEDITASNTIPYEKVADARISYGGRGQLTDLQQPRFGAQILDILNPF